MEIGNLSIDPLAVMALIGFGSLVAITLGLFIWLWRKSGKKPGEL
ncbi:hypothetical protein WNY37_17005 [Henriciella sp. AS95]